MINVNKPYPNEHAARLYEPSKLDEKSYHRTSGGKLYGGRVIVPDSVSVIWAKPKDADHVVAQAIRFPVGSWTEEKARAWLKDNSIHTIQFEPATGDVKKADTDVLVEAWDTLAADYQNSYEKKKRTELVQSALMFKSIHDELCSRPGVIFQKDNITPQIAGFAIRQNDIRDVIAVEKFLPQQEKQDVNLMVMAKEPTSVRGILRYTLGCVKDSVRPGRGDNIVKVCEVADIDCGASLDEVVSCGVSACEAVEQGNFFLPMITATSVRKCAQKGYIGVSRAILKAAHAAGTLKADKDMVVRLKERKIFDLNLDKHFGVDLAKTVPIIKGTMENGVVYGVVYPVNEVDADGDYSTPEEVQKACWRFMEDFQTMNLMHHQFIPSNDYAVVECACALADVNVNSNRIKKGDWYIAVKIKDPELRRMVESGELSAFSMEGSAMPGEEVPELESMKRRS